MLHTSTSAANVACRFPRGSLTRTNCPSTTDLLVLVELPGTSSGTPAGLVVVEVSGTSAGLVELSGTSAGLVVVELSGISSGTSAGLVVVELSGGSSRVTAGPGCK